MPEKKYKALVLGSTGLIGLETINLLLRNDNYDVVYAISRTALPIKNSKLINIIADYNTIQQKIVKIKVDHFFSCIGTTASKTPDKSKYYTIDLEYPIKTANILRENGCQSVCLVSSIGADSTSQNFYLKLKGDVEKEIVDAGLSSIHIFRPSLLLGPRKEFRIMEGLAKLLYHLFNPLMLGKWKDYRSIHAKTVAKAMINVALKQNTGIHIYQTQKIKELA